MQNNILTLLVSCAILIALCFSMLPVSVYAQGNTLPGTITSGSSSGGGSGIKNPLEASGSKSITDVLKKVINWMLGLVGILALIALIIGGARMIIDFGREDQVKKAKATITWAVIGLAVVMLSYAIINIVTSEILGAGSSGGSSSGSNNRPYDQGGDFAQGDGPL